MPQKIEVNKFSLKQILLICITTIICLATLGLGLGLGFGTNSKDNTPAQALQNENRVLPRGVTQVSAGSNHTMAIDSQGQLWAFGSNTYFKLGNMSATDSNTPINITAQSGNPLNGKQIVQVSAGGDHTMAIDSTGNLWAWGYNGNGQLGSMGIGDGLIPINITTQSGNPLNGKQIVQVSAGSNHTVAIDAQGDLWSFGSGSWGQLGNMSINNSSTPINITKDIADNPLNNKQIVQVSVYGSHTMAIDSAGNLWAFGLNIYGQLGDMSTAYVNSTPINITKDIAGNPLNNKQIVQVSAGGSHTMAIDSAGNLWAFGYNLYGQLGNMATTSYGVGISTPINLSAQHNTSTNPSGANNPLLNKQFVQVSAGNLHTMAIDSTGNLWAFGYNSGGQIGDMSTIDSNTAIKITMQAGNTLQGKQIVQVSAGSGHTMVIDAQGNLWAFGDGGSGKLGNMLNTSNSTPINITAQAGNPLNNSQFGRMQVSAGSSHTMAIDSQGNLWAFGEGSNGRLGNMSTTGSSTPINITTQVSNPLNGKQIVQVSAGSEYTAAIDSQGNLWAWGNNFYGQLGNMTNEESIIPINVTAQSGSPLEGKQIIQVSAIGSRTMAIDSSGNLWAFGRGAFGALGNMSTTSSNTPINLTAQEGNPLYGKQIAKVSSGSDHSMVIDASGNLWAFGLGTFGTLGDMSTGASSSTPINITAQGGNPIRGKQIVQVSVGGSHTIATDSQGNLWAFGFNLYGQLGNMSASTKTNSTPINISAQAGNPLNGRQIMQVFAVGNHTMAIDSQGNLWAFGYGSDGQLGNMSTTQTNSTPINITAQEGNPLNDKQIIQVSAGYYYTMAIDSQGNFWAFGDGSYGQLGNLSTDSSSTPINIQIPPQIVNSSATITGSSNAQIQARTNFTVGWGSSTASGGTVTTWTPNFLASPVVKRNDDTQEGRVRYEFDAGGVNKIESLMINGVSIDLSSEIPLSLWNNTLYLRTISAYYGRRLIVEMDRINTDTVSLAVTTSRNVGHNFSYVGNSHVSSRVKTGANKESTSASYVFENLTWTGNNATTAPTTIILTSHAPFEAIILDTNYNSYNINTFDGNLAELLPGAELIGTMSSTYSNNIHTITITIEGMEESIYNWWIGTKEMYQVQHMLNAPAGATPLPNPEIIDWVYSGSWTDYWKMFDSPGDIYGTFLGWFTHPTGGIQISDAYELNQTLVNTNGAVVFLYAHWGS